MVTQSYRGFRVQEGGEYLHSLLTLASQLPNTPSTIQMKGTRKVRQKNNDELLIKPSVIIQEQSVPTSETGNIGRGLFFGMLISIPLWISFFGWLRIFLSFVDKYI